MTSSVMALFHWIFPETPPLMQQLVGRAVLPQELVDMIVSYVDDIETLISCSETCRSWRYAAVPHFHCSLTTYPPGAIGCGTRREWPNPLPEVHKLRLLPSITRFRIMFWFNPERFGNTRNLRYFSALENLQELSIDGLELSSFMPYIKENFGHFPTLRSITLENPKASCRQLLYLIGLYPKLQDLKLLYFDPAKEDETTDSLALVPPSKPPLGGWLTLVFCRREEFVKEMIALYGKLPFRRVNISNVECAQRVLDGCVETLETLQLGRVPGLDAPYGEVFFFLMGGEGLKSTVRRTASRITFEPLTTQVSSGAQICCLQISHQPK
jgi:hypothetical protein